MSLFTNLVLMLCYNVFFPHHRHSPPTQKVHLVQLLWQLWPDISGCGHKASQFVDLLGYSTISTPEVLSKDTMCVHLVHEAIELLRCQNSMVLSHANCHVYSQLASLVDFDGYYLESEPCLVCNDPEVPFNVSSIMYVLHVVLISISPIFLPFIHLFVHPIHSSINSLIHLSIHLSLHTSIHPSIHLSIHSSIVHPPIHPSIHLSIHLSIYSSIDH